MYNTRINDRTLRGADYAFIMVGLRQGKYEGNIASGGLPHSIEGKESGGFEAVGWETMKRMRQ
jgi:hypothetical protein